MEKWNTMLFVGTFGSAAALYALKLWKQRKIKFCKAVGSMSSKVVVITGASSGLGYAVAKVLSSAGATVVATSPSADRCESARMKLQKCLTEKDNKTDQRIIGIPLDLGSFGSIDDFVHKLSSSYGIGKIDILINNAGIMGAPPGACEYGAEIHFGVNYLGHFYLTQKLDRFLKASTSARIINVTSGYYLKGVPAWEDYFQNRRHLPPKIFYASSKLAQCLHTLELSQKIRSQDLALCVRPGFVRGTGLGRHFNFWLQFFSYPLIWFFSRDVQEGIQTILHCCTSPSDDFKSGSLYYDCELENYNSESVNSNEAKKLWSETENFIQNFDKKSNL